MRDRHIPALDGIRGIAVLLVIAFHCRSILPGSGPTYLLLRAVDLGWSGVDLFFVLSGFLITGILLDTRHSPTYFRTFYARRILRIFPLYFVYLFVILVLVRFAGIWISGSDDWGNAKPWWYLTYLANWQRSHGIDDKYLGHLWSLSIEEQFYLIWPAVIWMIPPRRLAWWCLPLVVLAPVCRLIVGMQAEAAYRLTPCRMDALVLGAFVAIGVREFRETCDRLASYVSGFALMGFLMVVSQLHSGFWNDTKMATYGASLVDVVFACVVFAGATCSGGTLHRVLTAPLLRICGKYSYAMYIMHVIVVESLQPIVVSLLGKHVSFLIQYVLFFPAVAGITLGTAWVVWRTVELPFLRLKRLFPYQARERFCAEPRRA